MNPEAAQTPPQPGRPGWLRSRRTALLAGLLLLIGVVITVGAISRGKQAAGAATPLDGQIFTVKRGPLVISLLSSGQVKAKQVTEVKCLVFGDSKINWIIDEGTFVKAGDKLAELESSMLQESAIRSQIEVAQAKAAYEQAIQNLENQKSKNVSDIIIAQNKYDMAELDLEKYIKGDYQQKTREAESAIKLAEAELKRAKDRLDGTKKLLEKGFVNRGELEADTLEVTKQEIELEKATNAKDLLEKYEYKRETSSLETAKEGAQEELKRTKMEAESELANKKTLVESAKSELELEQYQLQRYERQLKNVTVLAPQDGMVVYAKNDYDDDSSRIRVGASVHYQQRLIDLPDFSSWRIEARIHESLIQQVKMGQKATINIDAFQNLPLSGEVERISVLPDSNRWMMDTKEYIVNLAVSTTTLPLKPGMTAKSEILMDSLKDVLYVPVQAISTVDGKALAYVVTETGPVERQVIVGQCNDKYAEIKSGLREGDRVMLVASENAGLGPKAEEEKKAEEKAKDGEKGKETPAADKPDAASQDAKTPEAVHSQAAPTSRSLSALQPAGGAGIGKKS